jgi:MFS family permease
MRAMSRPNTIIVALSAGLMLNQIALMALPAALVALKHDWDLDAAEIGWLGSIYFAGYAAGLPFLAGAANRHDGRIVYAVSAALAGVASLTFAAIATGFWTGLVLRFVSGLGFSGIHIVGMKLIADRLTGPSQARAGALYSAAYAIGSGLSFLVAGPVIAHWGWPMAFLIAGLASFGAVPFLLLIGPPLANQEHRSSRLLPDFRGVLQSPKTVRYILAYAGNTWEVFSIRVWFVPFLAYNAALAGNGGQTWNPSVLAAISAFIAVPVSILAAEIAIRHDRGSVIQAVSVASVLACVAVGSLASESVWLVLGLLMLHGCTSYGDAGAINSGLMASCPPAARSAAMTLFGLFGFVSGFLGSLAVGLAVNAFGGLSSATGWLSGFLVMACGSIVSATAMIGLNGASIESSPNANRRS